jgi:hypothetical protein
MTQTHATAPTQFVDFWERRHLRRKDVDPPSATHRTFSTRSSFWRTPGFFSIAEVGYEPK